MRYLLLGQISNSLSQSCECPMQPSEHYAAFLWMRKCCVMSRKFCVTSLWVNVTGLDWQEMLTCRRDQETLSRCAMPNAAAAARPPITAVWKPLRSAPEPVTRPLTAPKTSSASSVMPTEAGRAELGLPSM